MLDFAAMLRGHISRGTEVAEWNHLTTLSLEHIASLVARHPNIIGDELTEVLAQLTSGSQNLSAPGPA